MAAMLFAAAGVAQAQGIYVTNANGFGPGAPGTAGQYGLDGSTINASLITSLDAPFGIAASATNLFVTNNNTGNVGKYGLDGSVVNAALINVPGVTGATVSGTSLYLSDQGTNAIQQFDLNGNLINASFITGVAGPRQTAIAGGLFYVANNANGTVGLYNSVTGAAIDAALISGLGDVTSVAVSVDGTTLFVGRQDGPIGSYNALTGASIDPALITGLVAEDLDVVGTSLYVTSFGGTVGQYSTLDGSAINANLVSGLDGPLAAAIVVPEPASLAAVVALAGLLSTRGRRRVLTLA